MSKFALDSTELAAVDDHLEDGVPAIDTESVSGTVVYVQGDRFVDLRDALERVPEDGGIVQFKPQQYPFDYLAEREANNDGVTVETDNVWIRGAGPETVIYLEDGTTNQDEGARLLDIRADNVVVSDLVVDGNWQNNSPGETGSIEDGHNINSNGTNFHMFNVISRNGTGDGVELAGDDQTVTNCWFLNNWEHGIGLNRCQDFRVDNVVVDGEQNNAAIGTFSGSGNRDTAHGVVSNATIRNYHNRGLNIDAAGSPTRDVTFRDINIYGDGSTGEWPLRISDGGSGNPNRNIRLFNVNVFDAPQHGILIEQTEAYLRDCTVDTAQQHGININDPVDVTLRDIEIVDANRANNNYDAINPTTSLSPGELRIDGVRIQHTSTPYVRNYVRIGGGGSLSDRSYVRRVNAVQGENQAGGYFFPVPPGIVGQNSPTVRVNVADLAQFAGNDAYHDGSDSGSSASGPYVYDGSQWVGYGPASGSTI